jgi:phosphoribosylamine--glycine ligase
VFHHQTENPAGLRYNPATRRDPLSLFPFRTSSSPNLAITTSGGHVLCVVATAATLNGARGRAILNIERIHFNGCHYRGDIGRREFG